MHSSKAAWAQAALLVGGLVAIALAIAFRMHRPFDRDTLAIQIAQLRSSAAEAQLLADSAGADQLTPSFVRHHAWQMAQTVDTTNGKLKRSAQPEESTQKAQARRLGGRLYARLVLISREGSTLGGQGFDATSRALGALQAQLKPAD